ncbi:hypothetical protein ACO1O0_008573 [Amphichorda felina]
MADSESVVMKVIKVTQKRYGVVEGDYFIKGILPVGWEDLMLPLLWPAERIKNEHAALDLIREKTNIPVPRVLERGFSEEFGHYLKLEWASGIEMYDIVNGIGAGAACLMTPGQHGHATEGQCNQCRDMVMANADRLVSETLYPALEGLQSFQTGLNGTVIPPPWITEGDRREHWPVKTSDMGPDEDRRSFVLCHGDLSYHNMLVAPDTLEIKWLLDWECAGFFPKEFLRIFAPTRAEYESLFTSEGRRQHFIDLLE